MSGKLGLACQLQGFHVVLHTNARSSAVHELAVSFLRLGALSPPFTHLPEIYGGAQCLLSGVAC